MAFFPGNMAFPLPAKALQVMKHTSADDDMYDQNDENVFGANNVARESAENRQSCASKFILKKS